MTRTGEVNPTSILAKLRNLGRSVYPNLPANMMLLLYAQQGLLARLEASSHAENFVLKGALSLFARFGNAARPTEDIDLAARNLPNTPEAIVEVITEICELRLSDGLHLTVDSSSARVINEQLDDPGVTLNIEASLGSSRAKIQLDVSFGNAITPAPVTLQFPAILIPEAVRIQAYPLETVIAEKFAALAEIGEATTRMKDVFDLHTILGGQEFDARVMRLAFTRSFKARHTDDAAIFTVLGEAFAASPILQQRWQQYQKRNRFEALTFAAVMKRIQAFCIPLLLEDNSDGHWTPGTGWVT